MTSGPPPNPPPPASIPPDSDSDGFLTPRPDSARSMWVELIIVFLVTRRIINSQFGLSMRGIREN